MAILGGNGGLTKLLRPSAVGAAAVFVLLASGCASGSHGAESAGAKANAKGATKAKAPTYPQVVITPGNGVTDADTSAGITVTAVGGTLNHVTVHTSGDAVSGRLSQDGTVWHSQWALDVSQTYTVTATASRIGGGHRHHHQHLPHPDAKPDVPDRDRRGVQPDLRRGDADHPVLQPADHQQGRGRADIPGGHVEAGSGRVVLGRSLQHGCHLRVLSAACYWPTGTTVHFTGHLDGVQGAPGVYGTHTLTQTFNIGASLVAIGNTAMHRTQIYYNGKLLYDWPISSGRPGDATPDGSYLTIEKENPVQMVGPGYSISVPWSVRFTFSGDYYHDAYWSVGEQGFENVSHGCVNLSPADAQIYYTMAVPGDPITIVGSPQAGVWDNGWTEWFLSWPRYLEGSALHEAVIAGPAGSTFVNPASLPPSTATTPLQTAPANNSTAQ